MGALRRLLPIIFVAALLAVSCSSSSDSSAPSTSDTDTDTEWPYQFVIDAVDGSTIDTGDYAGQDLVLWFWAPW